MSHKLVTFELWRPMGFVSWTGKRRKKKKKEKEKYVYTWVFMFMPWAHLLLFNHLLGQCKMWHFQNCLNSNWMREKESDKIVRMVWSFWLIAFYSTIPLWIFTFFRAFLFLLSNSSQHPPLLHSLSYKVWWSLSWFIHFAAKLPFLSGNHFRIWEAAKVWEKIAEIKRERWRGRVGNSSEARTCVISVNDETEHCEWNALECLQSLFFHTNFPTPFHFYLPPSRCVSERERERERERLLYHK